LAIAARGLAGISGAVAHLQMRHALTHRFKGMGKVYSPLRW
jgi:hypothetical protein